MSLNLPFEDGLEIADLIHSDNRQEAQVGEGQLTIDVAQTAEEIIVVSTMAGTLPQDISVHAHGDLLTIRGTRRSPVPEATNYFCQECYWGKFSRTIVLPVEVQGELTRAEYRFGVLTIRLPKKVADNEIAIEVVEE